MLICPACILEGPDDVEAVVQVAGTVYCRPHGGAALGPRERAMIERAAQETRARGRGPQQR